MIYVLVLVGKGRCYLVLCCYDDSVFFWIDLCVVEIVEWVFDLLMVLIIVVVY